MFALASTVAFAAMALWSLATPLGAAPDEPAQVVRAAAVVRGELVGDTAGAPGPAFARVRVPAFFGAAANRGRPSCYHDRPTVPAGCAKALRDPGGELETWTYVARYPPLYYAIVGLPTLLGQGRWVLYAMRLVSALCSAVLLGLAAMCATCFSSNRFGLVGGLVALTPMALFLGGVVNPNGLEVAAALCVWTAGSVLVLEHLAAPPPALLAVLGGAACVLELTRSLSPLWLVLTAAVLAGIAEGSALRTFVAGRGARLWLAGIVAAGAVAVTWIVLEDATSVAATGSVAGQAASTILETSLGRSSSYLQDMVGIFGWLDTFSPLSTYVCWYGLIGLVAILGAAVARRRQAAMLGVLAAAIVVVPVAACAFEAHRFGYVWQGRDTLPLAVGLPVVAGALLGRSALARAGGRVAGVVGTVVVLAQAGAFVEALRRYAVGTAGPDLGFFNQASWHPPGGLEALVVTEAAVLVVLVVLVQRAVSQTSTRRA